MITQKDWNAALQSDHVKDIARKALELLKLRGFQGNAAAYDWAIQCVLQEEWLPYAEYGAVVHFLGNPWMLENQESSNECCISLVESTL